ncbi:M15 family metallopeptidase [Bacillus massilinigeriensis]|uniref:M15 family metallopeptidase n=1 Tax=Bacillus massilionigeriensis TaxID=1805475 RepID=UPI000A07A1AE|nr:M15 family metallopeptidase [Bacillus massilionigeriensis]
MKRVSRLFNRKIGGYTLCTFTIILTAFQPIAANADNKTIDSDTYIYEEMKQTSVKKTDFVRLDKLDKTIVQDLKYATKNNFTHKVQYNFKHAVLRRGTAEKLVKANTYLKKKYGYRMKVWDAYRPYKVQRAFWNFLPNANYVARPNYTSGHVLGVGVDVTLVDKKGKELKMPTKFDDFSLRAWRKSESKWTSEQRRNVKILTDAMKKYGFDTTKTEWWDYKDSERGKYKYVNVDPNRVR